MARAMFFWLFMHTVRRPASRAACTAGSNSPINVPMMVMTTSNSTNVKADGGRRTMVGGTLSTFHCRLSPAEVCADCLMGELPLFCIPIDPCPLSLSHNPGKKSSHTGKKTGRRRHFLAIARLPPKGHALPSPGHCRHPAIYFRPFGALGFLSAGINAAAEKWHPGGAGELQSPGSGPFFGSHVFAMAFTRRPKTWT